MKKLTSNDIYLNSVDTIEQFNILQYLKTNLNINEFDVFLCDRYTIKVINKNNEIGYFKYLSNSKKIKFAESKENDIEI